MRKVRIELEAEARDPQAARGLVRRIENALGVLYDLEEHNIQTVGFHIGADERPAQEDPE